MQGKCRTSRIETPQLSITFWLSVPCSSVLPLPFAFSRTGILLGITTMLVVGYCNAHTCALLLRAAGRTGHDSYEGVAEAIGGKPWKVFGEERSMNRPACMRQRARFTWLEGDVLYGELNASICIVCRSSPRSRCSFCCLARCAATLLCCTTPAFVPSTSCGWAHRQVRLKRLLQGVVCLCCARQYACRRVQRGSRAPSDALLHPYPQAGCWRPTGASSSYCWPSSWCFRCVVSDACDRCECSPRLRCSE